MLTETGGSVWLFKLLKDKIKKNITNKEARTPGFKLKYITLF
jgi:hypothetical protein